MNSRTDPLLLLSGFGSWVLFGISLVVLRSDRIDDYVANPTLIANGLFVVAAALALVAAGLLVTKARETRTFSVPLLSGVAGLTLVVVLLALATLKGLQ